MFSYILSPVPIEELKKLSPVGHSEFFNEEGLLSKHKFSYSPMQRELDNIYPLELWPYSNVFGKDNFINKLFWDLLYISLFYNEDYYVYILSGNKYKELFSNLSAHNIYSFINEYCRTHKDIISEDERWLGKNTAEELDDLITSAVNGAEFTKGIEIKITRGVATKCPISF